MEYQQDCYEKLLIRILEADENELKRIEERLDSFIQDIEKRTDLIRR